MNEINQRIRKARKLKFFTQEKLANMLGLKTSTYSQKEREGKIDCETLIKIAKALNVSTDYLLFGDTDSDGNPSNDIENSGIQKPYSDISL